MGGAIRAAQGVPRESWTHSGVKAGGFEALSLGCASTKTARVWPTERGPNRDARGDRFRLREARVVQESRKRALGEVLPTIEGVPRGARARSGVRARGSEAGEMGVAAAIRAPMRQAMARAPREARVSRVRLFSSEGFAGAMGRALRRAGDVPRGARAHSSVSAGGSEAGGMGARPANATPARRVTPRAPREARVSRVRLFSTIGAMGRALR